MFTFGTFADLVIERGSQPDRGGVRLVQDREIVHDPAVAEMLKPRTFPFGTKRLPLDTNYYETFNRPNVTLVDLRAHPDRGDHPGTGSGRPRASIDLDVIVYATGFDALTGPLLALGIQGRDGQALADAWAEGPRTYLGLSVPGFPNLFTITGPGSPSVLSNMPVSIEQHVEWIGDCLSYLREHGIDTIEAQPRRRPRTWTEHVQQVAGQHPVPEGGVLVHGRQHPGQAAAVPALHRRGRDITGTSAMPSRPDGYEGFDLSRAHAAASA